MTSLTRLLPSLGVLGLVGSATAQDLRPRGPWQAQTTQRGDSTIVRTISGSVWGEQVRLVEELRIGSRDGIGPDAFGEISAFAVFPNGVMAVFDASVPALRLFRPTGQHIRTLGRDGAGPGEYRNYAVGLAVDRNGILIMYDLRNARLNRWKADGTVLPAWPLGISQRLVAFNRALQVDTAGNTYLLIAAERMTTPRYPKQGLARFDRTGKLVDTLVQPMIEGPDDPPTNQFAPYKHWLLNRRGQIVSGFSGRYVLTVAGPGRGSSAVRIERVAPPVRLLSEERRSHQERVDAVNERNRGAVMLSTGTQMASIPEIKPVFRRLHADLDERIWVQLSLRAEPYDPPPEAPRPGRPALPPIGWRERIVWDVFAPDGRYLGQFEFPFRTEFAEARGNNVWAIQRGEDDEQYVVRYRITGAAQTR